MSDTMEYKGYAGSVEYSAEDELLYGQLLGISDCVMYDGEDVKTLRSNFEGAVDEYLAFCGAEGKAPDRPFKGSLNIRIPAELHRSLALEAQQRHTSLNSIIAQRLSNAHQAPLHKERTTGVLVSVTARRKRTGEHTGAEKTGRSGHTARQS